MKLFNRAKKNDADDAEHAAEETAAKKSDEASASETSGGDDEVRIERVDSSGVQTVDSAEYAVENNTWIVGDDAEVIVIDPAHDAKAVLKAVGERDVLMVICTGGHDDHTKSAVEVAERDDAPVALHARDRLLWKDAHPDDDVDISVENGGVFEIGDVQLRVIHTPGHTPGAIALYSEELEAVFTGDTLLAAGPGSVADDEFPDFATQLTSIGEHLLVLPGHTRILPARGEESTVSELEPHFDAWVAKGAE
jgi:glyoxylase-like metal-dependent hydrolase (beta-lactamase superfamily II)